MRCRLPLAMVALAALRSPVALAARAAREASSHPWAQVLGVVPIDRWGEWILIPVAWNGEQAFFIFDTGSSFTILSSADFPDLEPLASKVDVGTPGGPRTMQKYRPPDLRIGPFRLADSGPVFRTDLSAFRETTDRPIIGVLGVSAMKGVVVQVDFDRREVRFLRPDDRPHPERGTARTMECSGAALLLAHKANVSSTDRFGVTALQLAALNGYRDVAQLLLADGADVNARNNVGATALHGAGVECAQPEPVADVVTGDGKPVPGMPLPLGPVPFVPR